MLELITDYLQNPAAESGTDSVFGRTWQDVRDDYTRTYDELFGGANSVSGGVWQDVRDGYQRTYGADEAAAPAYQSVQDIRESYLSALRDQIGTSDMPLAGPDGGVIYEPSAGADKSGDTLPSLSLVDRYDRDRDSGLLQQQYDREIEKTQLSAFADELQALYFRQAELSGQVEAAKRLEKYAQTIEDQSDAIEIKWNLQSSLTEVDMRIDELLGVKMPLIDRILDQNVKGNWSKEVTLPGTAIQIGLSFTGVDFLGDLRDLTYDVTQWDGSLAHAGQTLLDAVSLLPVVGMLKDADEIAALSKQFMNNAPAYADAAKYALKNADNLTPGAKRALTTIIVAADRASKAVTAAGKRAGDAVQSAAKKVGDRLEELYRKIDEEWFKGEKTGAAISKRAGETLDPDNALALSTRFVNKMDPMWKNSENIKPISGYQDIVCHGDKTGFSYLDLNGNEINISPREFAEILKNSPVYEGQPIRLISCEAGADGSITAQYLANQLGVPVLAPTDIVYVYPDGVMKVGKYNTGRWVLFNPKER